MGMSVLLKGLTSGVPAGKVDGLSSVAQFNIVILGLDL